MDKQEMKDMAVALDLWFCDKIQNLMTETLQKYVEAELPAEALVLTVIRAFQSGMLSTTSLYAESVVRSHPEMDVGTIKEKVTQEIQQYTESFASALSRTLDKSIQRVSEEIVAENQEK